MNTTIWGPIFWSINDSIAMNSSFRHDELTNRQLLVLSRYISCIFRLLPCMYCRGSALCFENKFYSFANNISENVNVLSHDDSWQLWLTALQDNSLPSYMYTLHMLVNQKLDKQNKSKNVRYITFKQYQMRFRTCPLRCTVRNFVDQTGLLVTYIVHKIIRHQNMEKLIRDDNSSGTIDEQYLNHAKNISSYFNCFYVYVMTMPSIVQFLFENNSRNISISTIFSHARKKFFKLVKEHAFDESFECLDEWFIQNIWTPFSETLPHAAQTNYPDDIMEQYRIVLSGCNK
jgi:hypothetical protein